MVPIPVLDGYEAESTETFDAVTYNPVGVDFDITANQNEVMIVEVNISDND